MLREPEGDYKRVNTEKRMKVIDLARANCGCFADVVPIRTSRAPKYYVVFDGDFCGRRKAQRTFSIISVQNVRLRNITSCPIMDSWL